jgi:hypothetical protein
MKPLQFAAFEGLQGMATPVLDGKYAGLRAGDQHRLSMQSEGTGAIFGNIAKRRDRYFHGFSILEQRCA